MARAALTGSRRPWAAGVALLALLVAGLIYFLQPAPEAPPAEAAGEPLKLRLAPELKPAKP